MQRQRSVPVVFYQEGDQWIAQSLGVDVATFGKTLDDARATITEALEQYFEDGDEQVAIGGIHVETVVV